MTLPSYLQGTVLVTSDLVIAVTVTIEGSKHDAERAGPLTEKDEEMMSQRLLREEEAPVVDCTIRERVKKDNFQINVCKHAFTINTGMQIKKIKTVIYQEHTG